MSVLLVFGLYFFCCAALTSLDLNDPIQSPRLFFGPSDFIVTGTLHFSEPENACSSLEKIDSLNSILLVKPGNCYPVDKARNAQNAGYAGAILCNDRENLGLTYFYWKRFDYTKITIPSVEILPADHLVLKSLLEDGNVTVSITGSDKNPWENWTPIWIWVLYSLLILIPNIAIFYIVVTKLWSVIREKGVEPSLVQIVLAIEGFSCLIRFVYVIDPQSVFKIFPWGLHEALLTNTFTLSLITNILIAFYWQETLQARSIKLSFGLKKFKWPCIIYVVFVLGMEIATSVLYGMMTNGGFIILVKGLTFILSGLVGSVFFIYSGVMVLIAVKKMQSGNKMVVQLAELIIISGAFILTFTGVSISVPFAFTTPISYYLINLLAFIATEGISLTQVIVLQSKSKKSGEPQFSMTQGENFSKSDSDSEEESDSEEGSDLSVF